MASRLRSRQGGFRSLGYETEAARRGLLKPALLGNVLTGSGMWPVNGAASGLADESQKRRQAAGATDDDARGNALPNLPHSAAPGILQVLSQPIERLIHRIREFEQVIFSLADRAPAHHGFPVQHLVPIFPPVNQNQVPR